MAMTVGSSASQHEVMIEAVENHMPEVIIIDEIGRELETQAARTIAERGVQLIATAHGNTLENLLINPTLSDLIGGVQTVTLGDQLIEFVGHATQSGRRAPTDELVAGDHRWGGVRCTVLWDKSQLRQPLLGVRLARAAQTVGWPWACSYGR